MLRSRRFFVDATTEVAAGERVGGLVAQLPEALQRDVGRDRLSRRRLLETLRGFHLLLLVEDDEPCGQGGGSDEADGEGSDGASCEKVVEGLERTNRAARRKDG